MNNETGEESGDSIPQPEYETIEAEIASSKSTPTTHLEQDDVEPEDEQEEREEQEQDEFEEKVPQEDEIMMDDDDKMEYNNDNSNEPEETEATNDALDDQNNKVLRPFKNINPKATAAVQLKKLGNFHANKKVTIQLIRKEISNNKATADSNLTMTIKTVTPRTEEGQATTQKTMSQPQRVIIPRSTTPMSREMVALQRSVNESKILSEFATFRACKRNKSLTKDEMLTPNKSMDYGGYHITADNATSTPTSAEKQRKQAGRFVPLKYGDDDSCSSKRSESLGRRNKSIESCLENAMLHRKSTDSISFRYGRSRSRSLSKAANGISTLKVEERQCVKRTNMRSQNSDFVQKQKEFLSRVHRETVDNSEIEVDDKELIMLNAELMETASDLDVVELGDSKSNLSESNTTLTEALDSSSLDARLKPYWQTPPKVCGRCY